MAKRPIYRGHAKQFLAPVRARNVIGGNAPGIAATREKSNVAKRASIPGSFKSPGVNGTGWCDTHHSAYHSNAGMGGRKK
jgi:hypothetical protein